MMRREIGTVRRIEWLLISVLLVVLSLHAAGVCLDHVAAIRYPFELDYGEGIVWQQAALIPGPRMYSTSQALPFIVFHYPPVYYLLVRAAAGVMPDMLAAGRLLSAAAAVLIAVLVAGLVLVAAPPADAPRRRSHIAIAIAAGLLVLCLHAVQTWSLFMRVDMVAIALGLAGVLVAARSDGGFRAITCALLLCVASVYCKQTQLPTGMAIFLVALLRRPRAAFGAAAVALVVGLAALVLLERLTSGGFLLNIISYNVNRLDVASAQHAFWLERSSWLFMAVMLAAAIFILRGVVPTAPRLANLAAACRANRATAARVMLLLYFFLATLMLVTMLKSGGGFNYLIDCLCVGGVLIGVLLCDLAGTRRYSHWLTGLLILGALALPLRQVPDRFSPDIIDQQVALVQRIRDAALPVASEDMVLLMRAGKPVIFEPAIVTELAAVGRWDETKLVDMIRSGGFAFMITTNDTVGGNRRRSPAVDAAMRAAYPRVERDGPGFWLHLPR